MKNKKKDDKIMN